MLRSVISVSALMLILSAACADGTPSLRDWGLECAGCPTVFLDGQKPGTVGGQGSIRRDIDLRILGCTKERTTLHKQFLFDTPAGEYVAAVIFMPRTPQWEDKRTCFEMIGQYEGIAEFERMSYGGSIHAGGKSIGSLKVYRVSQWVEIPDTREILRADYPTPTVAPTLISSSLAGSTPTPDREEAQFAAQLTKIAPTIAAVATFARRQSRGRAT